MQFIKNIKAITDTIIVNINVYRYNGMTMFQYQKIVLLMEADINDGIYGKDERLPSLRHVCERYQVSMSTAILSYQKLEQQGVIYSRSKSGFFVSINNTHNIPAPKKSQPSHVANFVNIGQMSMALVDEAYDKNLIKLGAAVPDASLLPISNLSRIIAGVARRENKALATYEKVQGNIKLRDQIVKLMKDCGVQCQTSDIMITNGCLDAIGLALKSVAKAGDTIITESPTYFGILQVIEALGMKVVEVATDPKTGLDLDEIKTIIATQTITACIVMPTYSNPLGATMPAENKQKLVTMLSAKNIAIIEDDTNGMLSHKGNRPKALKAYDDKNNIVYCASFSKFISPSLRVGWLLAGKFAEQVTYQKFLNNISTSSLSQYALAELLQKNTHRTVIKKAVQKYQSRMYLLRQWVDCYFPKGTSISDPEGGFVLWVELPSGYDVVAIYKRAYEKNISITPGVIFSTQKAYKNHMRLSCASVDVPQLKESIKKLATIISD